MLTFRKITLDSASLGTPSRIPNIQKPSAVPFFICDESVEKGESDNFGKGMVASILPYTMQNTYDRSFEKRLYDAAILENEYLRAEFIPALGGRLWSLYDKKMKRELVYRNDSLIFANLALRNAWFAGGVEWNIGVRGHTFFTCDRMFARKVIGRNGHEILRMYEYEEIRGLAYCIEATLERDKLFVHISVKNTGDEPTYMYWWSNIAIEETAETRIFVPAEKTFVTSYREGGYRISKVGVPFGTGTDISYAKNSKIAIDYFYDLPKESKKWVSGLEKDGTGLLQYSDSILKGRKTFLWGKEPGGHHWNRWLTNKNETSDGKCGNRNRDGVRNYLEIQAGLCKTQFEHFPIDGGTVISWNEVYTGISLGTNDGDYGEVCAKIDSLVPDTVDFGDIFVPSEICPIEYFGSGKGYLAERMAGRTLFDMCEFPIESVSEKERYYLGILDGEDIAGNDETAFVIGKEWIKRISEKQDKAFFDYYTLGILNYSWEDYEKSLECLEKSVSMSAKYYNLAALGLLYSNVFENHQKGFECLFAAAERSHEYIPVAVLLGEVAIRSGRYSEFVSFYERSSLEMQANGRMRMYVGQCLTELGELSRAKEFINADLVVEDVREGEYAISNIWIMLYRKELSAKRGVAEDRISDAEVLSEYPIPYAIDFRMH